MGKLVLFLKDANPVEIPLDKERVTIGRRADNDVCLPYPAVSGEHAAIVTILADSFLEDLGSTNGTLVNGRPIAKHFLRDRDQVDIGRQLLVYLADAEAPAEPSAPVVREDVRESGRWVEAVRPAERVEPTLAAAIDDDLGLAVGSPGAERGTWRTEPALRRGAGPRAAPGARVPTEGVADETTFDAELAAIRQGRADATRPPEPEPDEKSVAAPVARGRLRVLTGPSAGRLVDIARDEFVLGRVGVQVAAIEWRDGALHLRPREGAAPPSVNGEPVPPEGRRIGPGDGLEVAGTRLEVVAE